MNKLRRWWRSRRRVTVALIPERWLIIIIYADFTSSVETLCGPEAQRRMHNIRCGLFYGGMCKPAYQPSVRVAGYSFYNLTAVRALGSAESEESNARP